MLRAFIASGLAILASAAIAQNQNPTVKSGKYVVELRMPSDGVYSGEESDIEFRLMDSTQNDDVLGMAGVPNAKVEALITMPSMEGMPAVKPKIHSEGVPGDYGVESFFPHGGEYQLLLKITPPGASVFQAKFLVNVSDERPSKGKPKAKPFELTILEGQGAKAGQPFTLKLQVRDSKTKQPVTAFDEAHTKNFHLLLASKDLVWFLHEHPEMSPDGTWTISVTFPAGGDYLVYGDVAPAGKGSQILGNKITVSGAKPTWPVSWKQSLGPSQDGGVSGVLSGDFPVGKSAPVTIKLFDVATGKLVEDLEPYLGAMGHLMIFSQDGQTVVHSHPFDDQSKPGMIQFNARFPKAGNYRAFAQFQRKGEIKTLSFTLEVKG